MVDYNAIAAAEEVIKLEVRQQYEYNWLDASRTYGANVANSLFPKVSGKSAPHSDEDDESDDNEQPAGE
ncbi:MAG: hypothetical protein LBR10_01050 [Prevotellaceae bacterium]|nr:hypothetical protein [Prevotellaceae bacterium]